MKAGEEEERKLKREAMEELAKMKRMGIPRKTIDSLKIFLSMGGLPIVAIDESRRLMAKHEEERLKTTQEAERLRAIQESDSLTTTQRAGRLLMTQAAISEASRRLATPGASRVAIEEGLKKLARHLPLADIDEAVRILVARDQSTQVAQEELDEAARKLRTPSPEETKAEAATKLVSSPIPRAELAEVVRIISMHVIPAGKDDANDGASSDAQMKDDGAPESGNTVQESQVAEEADEEMKDDDAPVESKNSQDQDVSEEETKAIDPSHEETDDAGPDDDATAAEEPEVATEDLFDRSPSPESESCPESDDGYHSDTDDEVDYSFFDEMSAEEYIKYMNEEDEFDDITQQQMDALESQIMNLKRRDAELDKELAEQEKQADAISQGALYELDKETRDMLNARIRSEASSREETPSPEPELKFPSPPQERTPLPSGVKTLPGLEPSLPAKKEKSAAQRMFSAEVTLLPGLGIAFPTTRTKEQRAEDYSKLDSQADMQNILRRTRETISALPYPEPKRRRYGALTEDVITFALTPTEDGGMAYKEKPKREETPMYDTEDEKNLGKLQEYVEKGSPQVVGSSQSPASTVQGLRSP